MKHPVLTRIFAVVLAVLCLVLLFAGLGSGMRAVGDWQNSRRDHERLTGRIEEYRRVSEELTGSTAYAEIKSELDEEHQEHDAASAKHRAELATYTATRGGIQAGLEAMAAAESALASGKKAYEQGLAQFEEQAAQFEEGYKQFQEGKKQLELALEVFNEAQAALDAAQAQLEALRAMGDLLESEDEDARLELSVAAYDQMLAAFDSALGMFDRLEERGGISEEEIAILKKLLEERTELDLGEITIPALTPEMLQEFEAAVQNATGMTPAELREQIQQARDALAARDADAPLTEEEFAAIREQYLQNKERIQQMTAAAEAQVADLQKQLADARVQLDEAKKQIDELSPLMEQGKEGIEKGREALELAGKQIKQGESALAEGRAQLEDELRKLKEQREKLTAEKQKLDAQAAALLEKDEDAQEQKDREQVETSVRLMLLGREEIARRVDGGMELVAAAEDYAAVSLSQAEESYHGRRLVALLMILGGVAGFAGIPAAFEKTKSRFWLLAPVLLCLALAAAAESLCLYLGRGNSYSALAVVLFALIQLLVSIPKKKA